MLEFIIFNQFIKFDDGIHLNYYYFSFTYENIFSYVFLIYGKGGVEW